MLLAVQKPVDSSADLWLVTYVLKGTIRRWSDQLTHVVGDANSGHRSADLCLTEQENGAIVS
jgi:hypothetical protein